MMDTRLFTEADYQFLGEAYEIIDGVPVEREAMSTPAVLARDTFKRLLDVIVDEKQSGLLFGDGLIYLAWRIENGIQSAFVPDISYLRHKTRLPEWDFVAHYPGVPDLAIEIPSEHDNAEKLMKKVRLYLERGCEQVWVVYPVLKELHQYRIDGTQTIHVYRSGDKLDASAFFPGVEIHIIDIFQYPGQK